MYNKEDIIKDLDKIIEYIKSTGILHEKNRQIITEEIVNDIKKYLNSGLMYTRKSADCAGEGKEHEFIIGWRDEGEYVYDIDGNRYIDLLSGRGVFTLGHRNDEVVKYVKMQLSRLGLHSQELFEPLRAYLARTFSLITPGDLQYSFFTSGGAEAVEIALKFARLYTKKKWYISTLNSYHGGSNGALSVTGEASIRKTFLPMIQQVYHVEYGDASEIRRAIENLTYVGESVAAVIVEPIQSKSGIVIPPKGYLAELRSICDEHEVLLIFDEIKTGMGRTGTLWRCEIEEVVPDILIFGKAVSGGVIPITGVVARAHLLTEDLIENPNLLGSPTFGGNPVACSAALAAIKYTVENDIPRVCKEKGEIIVNELQKLKSEYSNILKDVCGVGLLMSMEFKNDEIGYYIVKKLFENKILTGGNKTNARIVNIEPPACISPESIQIFITTLRNILKEAEERFDFKFCTV